MMKRQPYDLTLLCKWLLFFAALCLIVGLLQERPTTTYQLYAGTGIPQNELYDINQSRLLSRISIVFANLDAVCLSTCMARGDQYEQYDNSSACVDDDGSMSLYCNLEEDYIEFPQYGYAMERGKYQIELPPHYLPLNEPWS